LLHLYIDADACPVKEEVYRVARRYQLTVTLVANSPMRTPADAGISLQIVGGGLDAADDWIAETVSVGDIVISNDIPLASRCLAKGAKVLAPNGKPFTADNIGDALATRNLLAELRGGGDQLGGPPPFAPRDRSRFLQSLDTMIQALRQGGTSR
jgi:hypothetical protein